LILDVEINATKGRFQRVRQQPLALMPAKQVIGAVGETGSHKPHRRPRQPPPLFRFKAIVDHGLDKPV
jgi:hypothetical protein